MSISPNNTEKNLLSLILAVELYILDDKQLGKQFQTDTTFRKGVTKYFTDYYVTLSNKHGPEQNAVSALFKTGPDIHISTNGTKSVINPDAIKLKEWPNNPSNNRSNNKLRIKNIKKIKSHINKQYREHLRQINITNGKSVNEILGSVDGTTLGGVKKRRSTKKKSIRKKRI